MTGSTQIGSERKRGRGRETDREEKPDGERQTGRRRAVTNEVWRKQGRVVYPTPRNLSQCAC